MRVHSSDAIGFPGNLGNLCCGQPLPGARQGTRVFRNTCCDVCELSKSLVSKGKWRVLMKQGGWQCVLHT